MTPEIIELIIELARGNPGALDVCSQIVFQSDTADEALTILGMMKSLDLTGEKIWMLYKDECGEDIAAFTRAVIEKSARAKLETTSAR